MRLCWNDGFGCPLGEYKPEDAKFYRDIGFSVVGINTRATLGESSAADIEHAKRVLADAGLMPGPAPLSFSLVRPDPADMEQQKRALTKCLQVAGKLGIPAISPSAGSMNPKQAGFSNHPDNFTPRAMDLLVKYTRELAKVAEDNECVICPETTQWTVVHDIASMKEFVDRVGSPFVRVTFDFVNHMTADRVYDSGRYIRCAVETLGDRIGIFHVKDVQIQSGLVVHLLEAPMGTGLLDEETLIRVSAKLEPWKTFSLEHIRDRNLLKPAYDHIQGIVSRIGHRWTDPGVAHRQFIPKWRKTGRPA